MNPLFFPFPAYIARRRQKKSATPRWAKTMSAEDAEKYVASVAEGQGKCEAGDVVVFVDYRERTTQRNRTGVLEALEGMREEAKDGVRVVRGTLQVGDAIVCRVSSATEAGAVPHKALSDAVSVDGCPADRALFGAENSKGLMFVPFFVYERKTVGDLVATLQPGRGSHGSVPQQQRWLDQKARISTFCAGTGSLPALVLEGYMHHAETGADMRGMLEKRAHSALHSANRVHGLPFWNSAHTHDTARLLLRDANMLHSGAAKDEATPSGWTRLGTTERLAQQAADGASALVVRKSGQFTVDAWWRASLALVPGVSAAKAKALTDEWPSLQAMQKALQGKPSLKAQKELVADVRVGGRRIGPAVAERIVERVAGASESGAPQKKRKK